MKTLSSHSFAKWMCFVFLFILPCSESIARSAASQQPIQLKKKKNNEQHLELIGRIQDNVGTLGAVDITVYVDSVVFLSMRSSRAGKCRIILPLNKLYTIVFSGEGYVEKKIRVSTKVPSSRTGSYKFHFSVDLFEEIEGLDVSVLKKPVAILVYNNFMNAFNYDYNYTAAINESLQKLYTDHYNLKELEKTKSGK